MTPSELNRDIETGKLKPVYYFYGSEDYRMKEAEKKLVGSFLPKSVAGVNHITMTAAKGKVQDILNELAVVPMLGERQVLTITDIQALTPSDIEKILKLLTPPDRNRVVVMVTPSEHYPRKDTEAVKLLKKKTAEVEFKRLTGETVSKRIEAGLKEQKIEIDKEAMELVTELLSGDSGGLAEEINKMINYAGPGGRISRKDIANLSADYQGFKAYELGEYVAMGNLDKGLLMLENMLNSGEDESGIFFWLSSHFLDLYLFKNGRGLPPYKRWLETRLRPQAARFENKELEEIILLIAEAGRGLRDSAEPHRLILERLILNICKMPEKRIAS